MCQNELFQSSRTKNKFFKVQEQKTKLMYSLRVKTIVWPIFYWTEFGNQFTTTHYMSTNKIIHVYFSHMTYLMSHVTSLNNTCEWSYKLPHSGL